MFEESARSRSANECANETQRNAISIQIPAIPHEDTAIYSLDDFEGFQEPLGYISNGSGNLRGDEYPTYQITDPDNCHVLREIVYLNAIPQEIPSNGLGKGAWLADLESTEVSDVGNANAGFVSQAAPGASVSLSETAVAPQCPECGYFNTHHLVPLRNLRARFAAKHAQGYLHLKVTCRFICIEMTKFVLIVKHKSHVRRLLEILRN
ncbi:hypothetical protein TcWFU_005434 [Taenia crassiceps]|uniref:LITAF domain-containing protein n=1 Tax=Taenia crassiceps TaxID=6207 RepID=A0ABR4QGY1_9CEST